MSALWVGIKASYFQDCSLGARGLASFMVVALSVKHRKLSKAWQHLQLTKTRKKGGSPWLRWEDDSEEKDGEANATTLKYNVAMVHCMMECLQQLTLLSIEKLMACALCLH